MFRLADASLREAQSSLNMTKPEGGARSRQLRSA